MDKVVLFDGVCNLCNNSVQFLIKHDRKGVLKYASLQSDIARELLTKHNATSKEDEVYLDSIVFIDEDKIYVESDAALRISRYLKQPWRSLQYFRFIPRFIRDFVYRIIAKNRYRWFGKQDQCMIPDPSWQDRFLEGISNN